MVETEELERYGKNLNSHNEIQFTTVPKISSLFIEFLGCCTNKSEVGINV